MKKVAVTGGGTLAARVTEHLRQSGEVEIVAEGAASTVVYLPRIGGPGSPGPDMLDTAQTLRRLNSNAIERAVVISSAEIYGASHNNPGMIREDRVLPQSSNSIQQAWAKYETLVRELFHGPKLTVLRTAPVITRDGRDFYSDLFRHAAAYALPGSVSTLQLLTPDDFAAAIEAAVTEPETGTYNIAPAGVIPLDAALRLAEVKRIPVSRLLQNAIRDLRKGKVWPADQIEYIRYNWTVSGELARRELLFEPKFTSAQALQRDSKAQFDDFGMDRAYIDKWGRGGFKFLHKYYWRIESRGLANIPKEGKVVLTGVHRGFMPFDATMVLDVLVKGIGRVPRFLIHPCLVKMPPLNNAMTRWGGLIANQENADWVLDNEGVVGIYPEGIRGAFTFYKEAYRLHRFGRDEYVKIALRNRAPIVPFVTVGHAEIFPILARLDIGWFKRWTEWPFCPIAPPWPLAPIPLPSKWHMEFLPAIHLEREYPAEAAEDPAAVKAIGIKVRAQMQEAMDRLLAERKHVFFGTIFQGEVMK